MTNPRDEWRGLAPEARRAVQRDARHLRPHPDPRVSAVAERYARHALDWWSRPRVGVMTAAAGSLAAVATIVAGVLATRLSADTLTAIAVVLAFAIIVARTLRVRYLTKMELANKLARAPAPARHLAGPADVAASPEPEPHATLDLAVRFRRGGIAWLLGLLLGMSCLFLAYGLLATTTAPAARWFLGLFGALMIAVAAVSAVRMVRWGVRRPLVALDAAGVHLPRYGYTLPWAELAEVRLIPLRAAGRCLVSTPLEHRPEMYASHPLSRHQRGQG